MPDQFLITRTQNSLQHGFNAPVSTLLLTRVDSLRYVAEKSGTEEDEEGDGGGGGIGLAVLKEEEEGDGLETKNRKNKQEGISKAKSYRLGVLQAYKMICKAELGFGRTALCLSGGGSLAMGHMGVVMALMARGLLPRVISGTSGGSIIAAIMAVKTDEELMKEVFVPDIAVRYKERWFPPISTQLHHFYNEGVLIDNAEFKRTARRYFGTLTFEEAFERTGRNVAISVSPSRVGGGSGTRHSKLLLNHITNPHVLVASAVQASCA